MTPKEKISTAQSYFSGSDAFILRIYGATYPGVPHLV